MDPRSSSSLSHELGMITAHRLSLGKLEGNGATRITYGIDQAPRVTTRGELRAGEPKT